MIKKAHKKSLFAIRSLVPLAVLLMLVGFTTTAALFLAGKEYVYGSLAALSAAVCSAWLFAHYRKTIKKAEFLFDSIENDDYTFNFTEDKTKVDTAMLNKSLNRLKVIMADTKQRVVEREKYNELIINSIKTGIITLDEHGHIYQSNGEMLRMFGLRVLTHINHISSVEPRVADAINSIRAGEKRQVSFTNERGEVSVSIIASEIELDGRRMKVAALTDINNELAEKELESWIKLIRVLTHEIMNTLAPITSLSETLLSITDDKGGDTAKGLTTISDMSRNLATFVESYRKFTNLPAPDKQVFLLKPLLESVASLYEGGGQPISISVDPEDIVVHADETLAAQVFNNIVRNARQAVETLDDPAISINARIDPSENIVVEITNNGEAIAPEVAENIFMPFYTTRKKGSGIGLSVSRQIMRLHGGSLYLSQNMDGKVTFTVVFE